MKAVFADTSYYLALFNPSDEFNAIAVAATDRLPNLVVTTAWILTEFADALCKAQHRELAAQFIRDLREDSRVEIISPNSELFEKGFELFCSRPDKNWSLTDCISFVVMQEQGIQEALTADRHFEQAGFSVLLS